MDLIEVHGSRRGATCTGILIQDLCRLCVTLKEFGWYLKKIENYEALEALGWPNGMSKVNYMSDDQIDVYILYTTTLSIFLLISSLCYPTEPVIIKTQPHSEVLREGGRLNLSVEAIGYPPPSYQWYKDDNEIPGEMLCQLTVDKVTMATDGKYKCLVCNEENSVFSSEVTVRIMRGKER